MKLFELVIFGQRSSLFEMMMLICFGLAWPFSIAKSLRTRQVAGKSLAFLVVLLIGYVAGVLHKVFINYNWVMFMYILNGTMVLTDIILYLRNRLYHIRRSLEEAKRREPRKEPS